MKWVCNVQKKHSIQRLWDLSAEKWGKIDVWINNAGQNAPYSYAHETEQSYVDNIIATNITGMIYGSQIAAKCMVEQNHGDIRDIYINLNDSLIERMHSYIDQIKNPYCFKYKNIIVTLDFVGNESIEDKIAEFLTNKKAI